MSRIHAWILARAEHIPLRDRLAVLKEEGSYPSALRKLGLSPEGPLGRVAETAAERLDRAGYRLLVLGDRDYPPLLAAISDPPIALTVRGELLREDALGLSIVGARRATPYGRDIARRLSRELASSGLTIVSGLARGIDAAAHLGALEAQEGKGRTLAVLGSGLDCLYPPEHRELSEQIAGQGALLSELDLDEPPLAQNFPRRNRIITGLTLGTLVVEAAEKSGSLISARLALEQDREVFAVPGPVSSPGSEGVHALLRDGARLVTRAEHVLEEFRDEVREALKHRATERVSPSSGALDSEERAIVELLHSRHDALDLDVILDHLSLPIDRAIAALGRLEIAGRVARLPGGLYHAKRG